MSKEPEQQPTVLIVDDIEDNRKVMRDFLTLKHNCRVVEAEDGEAALKLALSESLSLILMDMVSPNTAALQSSLRCASDGGCAAYPLWP